MSKHLYIWIALAIVVSGTAIGVKGHFWIGIAADFLGVFVAVGGKLLAKRGGRSDRPRG